MKIGIYGGTFDPIHNGHLILAQDAIEFLNVDRIIFMPNVISPHKEETTPAPKELRYSMVEAAVADEPRFEVSDWEIQRQPPSYSIDMVLHLMERFADSEFFFLIGEDNLAQLHTWRRVEELHKLVTFVVFTRGMSDTVHPYVTIKRRIDISASEIRLRVAQGQSIRYFVPESVLTIIEENKLYREVVT